MERTDATTPQVGPSHSKPAPTAPPRPRMLSPRAFIEFATFASKFSRARKPVRFEGKFWRL